MGVLGLRLSRVLCGVLVGSSLWACQSASVEPAAIGGEYHSLVFARAGERPTPGSSELPAFDVGDSVETFDSPAGFFKVHYARAGRHAVPSDDEDTDGTADYVQRVAADYDEVLKFYEDLGYRPPFRDGGLSGDNGGDDRFDVYLLDFPTSADGQFVAEACDDGGCSGYMRLENDFNDRAYPSLDIAIRLVASHEFFHAVQAAYLPVPSSLLAEGTAVWASEAFDPVSGDLERQSAAYFRQPERTLTSDPAGVFDGFTYGSAVFFQCLDERFGRDVLRELWERLAADGGSDPERWPGVLDALLLDRDSSLADLFSDFAQRNLFTGARHDAEQGYAHGDALPLITEKVVNSGHSEATVRVFPLAARYYSVTATERTTLMAAADLPDDPGQPGLVLLAAAESGGRITALARGADEAGHVAQLDLDAGDVMHVVLLNNRHAGESLRPRLCIGTEQELESCRGDAAVPPSAQDAGTAATPSTMREDAATPQPDASSGGEPDEPPDAGAPTRLDAGEEQDDAERTDSNTAEEPEDSDAGSAQDAEAVPSASAADGGGCNVQHGHATGFGWWLMLLSILGWKRFQRACWLRSS
jgi:hypothetical protein